VVESRGGQLSHHFRIARRKRYHIVAFSPSCGDGACTRRWYSAQSWLAPSRGRRATTNWRYSRSPTNCSIVMPIPSGSGSGCPSARMPSSATSLATL
jgi:hypothetical protein